MSEQTESLRVMGIPEPLSSAWGCRVARELFTMSERLDAIESRGVAGKEEKPEVERQADAAYARALGKYAPSPPAFDPALVEKVARALDAIDQRSAGRGRWNPAELATAALTAAWECGWRPEDKSEEPAPMHEQIVNAHKKLSALWRKAP